jgi:hypothetical protein
VIRGILIKICGFLLKIWKVNQEGFVPVLDCFVTQPSKNWVRIDFEDSFIECTEDHEIKTTNRGWVPAGKLTEDDDIEESEKINIDDDHLYLSIGETNVKFKKKTHSDGDS